jgi:hypothetical protein
MSSHVLAHGVVAGVEARTNELGDADFTVVALDTLGGVSDVCAAPGSLERQEPLQPGAVLGGTFWLVGRPFTLRAEAGPVPLADPADPLEARVGEQHCGLGRHFGRRNR